MNAKELREAAQRLIDYPETNPDDVTGLADHILATVREDDDEPVTPLWMSPWGAVIEGVHYIGILVIDTDDWNWSVHGEFGEVYIPPKETHGQFRSFCRGLGITLTEGGQ